MASKSFAIFDCARPSQKYFCLFVDFQSNPKNDTALPIRISCSGSVILEPIEQPANDRHDLKVVEETTSLQTGRGVPPEACKRASQRSSSLATAFRAAACTVARQARKKAADCVVVSGTESAWESRPLGFCL